MSSEGEGVIRELSCAVAELRVEVRQITQKVDSIEKKIDEKQKRFTDKYLIPVLATISAGIVLYWFTTISSKMMATMDAIAKGAIKP